jgi:hypothetical protein
MDTKKIKVILDVDVSGMLRKLYRLSSRELGEKVAYILRYMLSAPTHMDLSAYLAGTGRVDVQHQSVDMCRKVRSLLRSINNKYSVKDNVSVGALLRLYFHQKYGIRPDGAPLLESEDPYAAPATPRVSQDVVEGLAKCRNHNETSLDTMRRCIEDAVSLLEGEPIPDKYYHPFDGRSCQPGLQMELNLGIAPRKYIREQMSRTGKAWHAVSNALGRMALEVGYNWPACEQKPEVITKPEIQVEETAAAVPSPQTPLKTLSSEKIDKMLTRVINPSHKSGKNSIRIRLDPDVAAGLKHYKEVKKVNRSQAARELMVQAITNLGDHGKEPWCFYANYGDHLGGAAVQSTPIWCCTSLSNAVTKLARESGVSMMDMATTLVRDSLSMTNCTQDIMLKEANLLRGDRSKHVKRYATLLPILPPEANKVLSECFGTDDLSELVERSMWKVVSDLKRSRNVDKFGCIPDYSEDCTYQKVFLRGPAAKMACQISRDTGIEVTQLLHKFCVVTAGSLSVRNRLTKALAPLPHAPEPPAVVGPTTVSCTTEVSVVHSAFHVQVVAEPANYNVIASSMEEAQSKAWAAYVKDKERHAITAVPLALIN